MNSLLGTVVLTEKTVIVDEPVRVDIEHYETFAAFNCSAESDASTPVSIRWYHVDRHGDESLVHNITDRIVIADNGTLLLYVPENSTDVWLKLSGTYRCQATNGYSVAIAEALLVPSGVVITPAPRKSLHMLEAFLDSNRNCNRKCYYRNNTAMRPHSSEIHTAAH